MDDLANYPYIILLSDKEWDPSKISFPNISEDEVHQIESRNVAYLATKYQGDSIDRDPQQLDDDTIYNPLTWCDRLIRSVRINPNRCDN